MTNDELRVANDELRIVNRQFSIVNSQSLRFRKSYKNFGIDSEKLIRILESGESSLLLPQTEEA